MKRIYTEIGIGNESFISTEIEEGDKEERFPKFIKPKKIDEFYFRFWIFKKVFIISTKDFIKLKTKTKNKFKIIFGIAGKD